MAREYPRLLPLLISPLGFIIPLAPRSGALFVLLLGVAGIVHFVRRRPSLDWLRTPPIYALGAFLIYLFLSALWSVVPERSLEQAFRLTLLAGFGLAGFSLIRSLEEAQRARVIQCLIPALIVGVIAGCIYGLLQYTGPYIRIVMDFLNLSSEFSSFGGDNRLHIAKTMLLTNFAFFAVLPWLWKRQPVVALIAYSLLLTICWHSDSQSAFITCLAGGVLFAALRFAYDHSAKIIIAGIVASFICAVPVTQLSYLETVKAYVKTTPISAQSAGDLRIEIYQLFGSMSLKKPFFGHGLMAGVKYNGALSDEPQNSIRGDIRTPHNLHLQIVFDLGAVGTALLLLSFIWPLWRWHISGRHDMATSALLLVSLVLVGTLFNFVIWRSWIPGAAILTFYFLLVSAPKARLSDFR